MNISPLAGSVLRVSSALLLCAACFQAGRWYQELSTPVPVAAVAEARPAPAPAAVEAAPVAADQGDIITPLNVRDPSALVMGPAGSYEAPAAAPPPPPKAEDVEMEAKLRALSQARLLEILRKAKKNDAPKDF